MAQYRGALPQLEGELFLTDGGIETTLVFHEGIALPDFAAFVLLNYRYGQEALRKYFRTYCALASHYGTGLILESPTWRANPDWASHLGFTPRAWPRPIEMPSPCCRNCAVKWKAAVPRW